MPDPVDPKLLEITDKPVEVPEFKMGAKPSTFDLVRLFIYLVKQLKVSGTIEGGDVKVKPGVQTTEFWVTLVSTVMALGVGAGYLPKDFPQTQATTIVSQIAGAVVAMVAVWKYMHGRTQVKVASLENKPCDTPK
jgi:hypothetical protein